MSLRSKSVSSLQPTVALAPLEVMAGEAGGEVNPGRGVWRGLLWCEWFAHSRLLLCFIVAWLSTVWSLPLFAHPGWILLVAAFYALCAGPAYGGGDVVEGCEEFSFALPATRGQRYLARLVVGGGSLLLFTGMDFLALGLDLSQALARLYLDTGLVRPVQVSRPGWLSALVFALPWAVFCLSFALAACTHSRTQVFMSWFWASLGALVVLRAGLQYEQLVQGRMTCQIAVPLLMLVGGLALVAGYFRYCRKEIGPASSPIQLPGFWWMWTILFLVGAGAGLFLIAWLARFVRLMLGS